MNTLNGPQSDFIPTDELEAVTLATGDIVGMPLPILGQEPARPEERGDAARNRRLVLDTAAQLVAEQGLCSLTMDELARRAGVGKGTIFRRFGSRAGLMHALLDHSEQQLQAAYLTGPPPLGPGAAPVERLVAFGRARLSLIEVEGDVREAAESSAIHFSGRPHLADVAHVEMLLGLAGTRGQLRLLAEGLLSMLDARLVLHEIDVLGLPLAAVAENWEMIVRRLTRP